MWIFETALIIAAISAFLNLVLLAIIINKNDIIEDLKKQKASWEKSWQEAVNAGGDYKEKWLRLVDEKEVVKKSKG